MIPQTIILWFLYPGLSQTKLLELKFSQRHTYGPYITVVPSPQVFIDTFCEFPGKLTLEGNIWLLDGPKIDKTAK